MLPWLSEHSSIIPAFIHDLVPDSPAFLAYAGLAFFVIYAIAGVIAIRSAPSTASWFVFGVLLAARLENAIFHCIESIALMMYTPGVATAALIVLPLTAYLLSSLTGSGFIRSSWIAAIFITGMVVQSAAIVAMLTIAR